MGIFWRFRGVRDSVLGSSEFSFSFLFFLFRLLLLLLRLLLLPTRIPL